jgi:hypothetical protein
MLNRMFLLLQWFSKPIHTPLLNLKFLHHPCHPISHLISTSRNSRGITLHRSIHLPNDKGLTDQAVIDIIILSHIIPNRLNLNFSPLRPLHRAQEVIRDLIVLLYLLGPQDVVAPQVGPVVEVGPVVAEVVPCRAAGAEEEEVEVFLLGPVGGVVLEAVNNQDRPIGIIRAILPRKISIIVVVVHLIVEQVEVDILIPVRHLFGVAIRDTLVLDEETGTMEVLLDREMGLCPQALAVRETKTGARSLTSRSLD